MFHFLKLFNTIEITINDNLAMRVDNFNGIHVLPYLTFTIPIDDWFSLDYSPNSVQTQILVPTNACKFFRD